MGNIDFKTIGFGYNHKTKAGNPCIRLKLDCRAFTSISTIDIKQGVYIFRNEKNADAFTVMAPVDKSYELDKLKLFEKEEKIKEEK